MFGQVKDGYMEIRGPLVEVEWDEKEGERVLGSNRMDDVLGEDEGVRKFYWLGLLVLDTPYPDVTYHMAMGLLLLRRPGAELTFSRAGFSVIQDRAPVQTSRYDPPPGQAEAVKHSARFIDALLSPERIESLPDEGFDSEKGYAIKIV
jgi:hypothetical protein